MGLQRTPPPGKAPISSQNAGVSNQADTTLPSPSQAFAPRNPGVMRSPQSGSGHASSSTSNRPIPAAYPPLPTITQQAIAPTTPAPAQHLAAVDEGNVSTTPLTAPPARTPAPAPVPAPAASAPTPHHPAQGIEDATMEEPIEPIRSKAPTTPAAKRRKSRHPSEAPPPPLEEARQEVAIPVPVPAAQTETGVDYGPRYKMMMQTLGIAVDSSSHRMTLKEFTRCFPLFAAKDPESFALVYENTRQTLRRNLWAEASATLEEQGFGTALQRIDETMREAKENATTTQYGRSSAWRPDLSAKAMCAAANLPVYDEAYSRLRTEYLGLHEDCSRRYASITEKQALSKQLESTVSDGVVDLEKAIETMAGFPTEEMRKWMEDITPSLDARSG